MLHQWIMLHRHRNRLWGYFHHRTSVRVTCFVEAQQRLSLAANKVLNNRNSQKGGSGEPLPI
jgi:hypothetical protein